MGVTRQVLRGRCQRSVREEESLSETLSRLSRLPTLLVRPGQLSRRPLAVHHTEMTRSIFARGRRPCLTARSVMWRGSLSCHGAPPRTGWRISAVVVECGASSTSGALRGVVLSVSVSPRVPSVSAYMYRWPRRAGHVGYLARLTLRPGFFCHRKTASPGKDIEGCCASASPALDIGHGTHDIR